MTPRTHSGQRERHARPQELLARVGQALDSVESLKPIDLGDRGLGIRAPAHEANLPDHPSATMTPSGKGTVQVPTGLSRTIAGLVSDDPYVIVRPNLSRGQREPDGPVTALLILQRRAVTQDPGDLFEGSRLRLRNNIRPVSARPRRANVCGSGTTCLVEVRAARGVLANVPASV